MWMIINQNQHDYLDPPSVPASPSPRRHTAECVLIHADPGMQASVGAKSIPNDSQTAADFSDNFREISILLALSREFNDATYLFEK
jgi:hypothetical protein